jgi:RND family efflux transporter MFP subunit
VTEIAPGRVSLPVTSGGVLSSSDEIRLSFKTGGLIQNIYVKEGQKVRKGELLATLDLSEITGQVTQARNAFDKAQRDYNRTKNLFRDSVATLEQMQNAETGLNLARSAYDIATFNLSHSKINAPADGIILKQLAKTNEMIAPGYPAFLFGTTGKNWKVKAGFSDREIVRINPGDSASITMDAYPGKEFYGVVDQVGQMANPMTGTYEVEILLGPAKERLAPGFMATVQIFPVSSGSKLIIPAGAITEADGKTGSIFVLNPDSTVRKMKVEIKALTDSGALIEELPGKINKIVTDGAAYLNDGDTVKVVN